MSKFIDDISAKIIKEKLLPSIEEFSDDVITDVIAEIYDSVKDNRLPIKKKYKELSAKQAYILKQKIMKKLGFKRNKR